MYKNYLTDMRNKYSNYDIAMLTQTISDIAGDFDLDNIDDDITKLKILVQILEQKTNLEA